MLLRRLLSEGSASLDAKDERSARALIQQARAFTTELTVVIDPPSATVTLDSEDVGASPLAEVVPVDAGPHTLDIRKEGARAATRAFTAVQGASLRIEVALEREETRPLAVVTAPAPTPRAPEPKRRSVILPWTFAGAGAATLGLGAYFGAEAIERANAGDKTGFSTAAWTANICIGVGLVGLRDMPSISPSERRAPAVRFVAPSPSPRRSPSSSQGSRGFSEGNDREARFAPVSRIHGKRPSRELRMRTIVHAEERRSPSHARASWLAIALHCFVCFVCFGGLGSCQLLVSVRERTDAPDADAAADACVEGACPGGATLDATARPDVNSSVGPDATASDACGEGSCARDATLDAGAGQDDSSSASLDATLDGSLDSDASVDACAACGPTAVCSLGLCCTLAQTDGATTGSVPWQVEWSLRERGSQIEEDLTLDYASLPTAVETGLEFEGSIDGMQFFFGLQSHTYPDPDPDGGEVGPGVFFTRYSSGGPSEFRASDSSGSVFSADGETTFWRNYAWGSSTYKLLVTRSARPPTSPTAMSPATSPTAMSPATGSLSASSTSKARRPISRRSGSPVINQRCAPPSIPVSRRPPFSSRRPRTNRRHSPLDMRTCRS